jgi:hypothetical protein
MPKHDIFAIGASGGGVEALQKLVSELPADFPGALFVRDPPAAADQELPSGNSEQGGKVARLSSAGRGENSKWPDLRGSSRPPSGA